MSHFQTIGLIVKAGDDSVAQTVHDVIACVERHHATLLLDESTRPMVGTRPTLPITELAQRCDVAVVIGGDGTLLHAARMLVDHRVPLIGVNRGRLGFLVDVSPDAEMQQLSAILDGQYLAEDRIILETRILREGASINHSYAFNDAVIRVHDLLQLMDFDIIIDDVLVTHQRADGLIVATPSGSTAYALSNGGPIVGPTISALLLQPICPHTLTSRPLMVEAGSTVRVHLWDDQAMDVQVICDGQVYMPATLGDMIDVRAKRETVRMLHPETYDYHRILREKLNWG